MILIVMTVIVIACLIAGLAYYLLRIGIVLNRTAKTLGDCLQSLQTSARHVQGIGPNIKRLNKSGTDLLGAMPLLVEDADAVAAKVAPSAAPSTAPSPAAPAESPVAVGAAPASTAQPGVGYMDAASKPAASKPAAPESAAPESAHQTGMGYMDE